MLLVSLNNWFSKCKKTSVLKLESPRRKPVMYFQTVVLSAGIECEISGVENVVGDFIFSDDELVGSKA